MEKGRVVIFAAGTGNPFFTTDTAAALRAAEMRCDRAPEGGPRSTASTRPIRGATLMQKRYEELTYLEVLSRDLGVMDAAAISLSRENRLPIIVFNIHAPGAFAAVHARRGALHENCRARLSGCCGFFQDPA